ncbi:MAG: hypothetical protein E6G97_00475 [Alphaproteobacteria bacterium]|nr:MAG: hypothetical protein E6G97_00475 [Alphaproteobacteria bacterium]
MSVQPPAAPHRVSIADIEIPFWRLVVIMIKWMFAAIPAAIIFSIIVTLITLAFWGTVIGLVGGLNIPGVKM